jgi:Icc-related predicted phosphoesterase
MNKIINKLESSKIYENYLLNVNNLDYLYNRASFNQYVKKFLCKCIKYDIKIFFYKNDTICILNKNDIFNQIDILKKDLLNLHINLLLELNKDEISTVAYINKNKAIMVNNYNKMKIYDKFRLLVNIVYDYSLLELNIHKKESIDFEKEYNNLVNLSNIIEDSSSDNIIFIDSYSTKN